MFIKTIHTLSEVSYMFFEDNWIHHRYLEKMICMTYHLLYYQKTQYGNTIRELELAIKGRDNKLRLVVRKNQEVEMEVQDLMDKIGEW